MATQKHDLVVIGAGPGGYVAAIRAAQLGLNVACIEKEKALGGTCVRVGCIPSKALLESSELYEETKKSFGRHGIKVGEVALDLAAMLKRKDDVVGANTKGVLFLFKKNRITRYTGTGRITAPGRVAVEGAGGADDATVEIECRHIVIATGSVSAPLRGITIDGDKIGTSTEALEWKEVPGHLVVIGAGAIGLEIGSVWKRLGAKVTVLEYFDRIVPGMDAEIAAEALRIFKKQGLNFILGARVTGASIEGKEVVVQREGGDPIRCDRLLVSVGRLPNTAGVGLEAVGIELDARGRVPVNDHFETKVPGIYAIGDVITGPMLAHKAEEEGVACVERIVTGWGHVDYNSIPSIVYTHPEIASVGRTEEDLKGEGIAYKVGAFPFTANGRARALGQTEGKAKILADATTDRILGVHIVGARAGDLIAECAVAMAYGASAEDLARANHAHPTLAEILKEAALGVDGRSIHI